NPFSRNLASETVKIILSSIPIGLVCYLSLPYFQNTSAATLNSFVSLAIKIAIVGLISVIPFFALSHLFKLDSFAFLKSYALTTLKKFTHK
ncbi:MAG TPA: hypothetical protein PKX32_06865, partial [Candidatus Saccharicenans sp.]|nr:hypothetical protein [Candidatus Saccharicenans sp.]